MVLARVANFLTNGDTTNSLTNTTRRNDATTMEKVGSPMANTVGAAVEEEIDEEVARPPYSHVRMPSWDEMGLN
jgi:hypothetical protein